MKSEATDPLVPRGEADVDASTCELCKAVPITTWWYEDELCWVAECESCGVPMVVWKQHDPNPAPGIREQLLARLRAVADEHARPGYWIDEQSRTTPDHYHAHARKRPFM